MAPPLLVRVTTLPDVLAEKPVPVTVKEVPLAARVLPVMVAGMTLKAWLCWTALPLTWTRTL